MTDMFSQYPPGTTGSFTVNYDGSVKLEVKIPKPRNIRIDPKRELPNKRYWMMDGSGMSRTQVKEFLKACGAMWAFTDPASQVYVFSVRPNVGLMTNRIAETDRDTFLKAVAQSGWDDDQESYRVVNVRDIPLRAPY